METKDNHLVFVQDHEFTGLSLASSVIKGGASNGLISWKNLNGVSLKEIEQGE